MSCQSCGMAADLAEFHPHLFCVLFKAGVSDPRAYLTAAEWSYTPGRSFIPKTVEQAFDEAEK